MRAILIDDDPTNSQILALKIRRITTDIDIIATFEQPTKALLEVPALQPDVLFIDIDMPLLDGFSLAMQLAPKTPAKVVFVTAYSQYTLNALRVSAFDYLTKPVEPDELRQTITRLFAQAPKNTVEQRLTQLESLLQQHNQPQTAITTLALPTLESIQYVNINDIIYIEASSNYSVFYLTNQTNIIVSKTLKEYEDTLLHPNFMRINRSTIVNLGYVKAYVKRDGGFLLLQNNAEITISPNRKEDILAKLQQLHK
jgi:two-component system, LytTR family, response regulator